MGATEESDAKRQFVRDYINDNCIIREPEGSQRLLRKGGGGYYRWQFYLRAALYQPKILNAICDDFFEQFPPDLFPLIQLAGVDSAATPLLTALALHGEAIGIPVNIFSIRKDQKKYGLRNWIEGIPSNKPVMLVDDLTSDNHYTMRHAMRMLKLHNLACMPIVYAVVYKSRKPDEPIPFEDKKYEVAHMFSLKDFEMHLEEYERVKSQRNDVEAHRLTA